MKMPTREVEQDRLRDAVATAEVLFSLGQSEAQAVAHGLDATAQTEFAREFCAAAISAFWAKAATVRGWRWEIRKPPVPPLKRFFGLIERLGTALVELPAARAGFLAGQLYTALLPETLRKALGAYYTPPPLVERLLEMVTQTGFDWTTGRIIDPACGGAAFLASVAPRMVKASARKSPAAIIDDIEARLLGVELDPFAAWMAMVLLDVALLETVVAANRLPKALVLAQDALDPEIETLGGFDLVVGNPPYGKITLPATLRHRFRESLFGHANLYGLFTELAVRFAKPGGLIAYVTPTSILGGEYFKNLRGLLSTQAPLRRLDFIAERDGVFDGVLQETMLAVFVREPSHAVHAAEVNLLCPDSDSRGLTVEPIGNVPVAALRGNPWLLPRSRRQSALVRRFNAMPHRLADYHFSVATGQLVWNRHKEQLRASHGSNCYPIIWAEAVTSDGQFQFQAARRTHLPYLELKSDQEFLINQEPCILVQRTTAKEQRRRLFAAVIPNSFVCEYPGFVVENHLNMVYTTSAKPRIGLRTIAALLNSETLDQAFRCINGSVAVSAYELNSLPLPNPEQMRLLQQMILAGAPPPEIERQIAAFYSSHHEPSGASAPSHSRSHHRKMAA